MDGPIGPKATTPSRHREPKRTAIAGATVAGTVALAIIVIAGQAEPAATPADAAPLDGSGSVALQGALPEAMSQDGADRMLPKPQHLVDKGSAVRLDDGWQVAVATSDPEYVFAAQWLNDKLATDAPLELEVVDGATVPPRGRRIVIGDPAEHSHVRDAMLQLGRGLPNAIADEGYLLEVFDGAEEDAVAGPEILIAANTAQGAFYGVVSLLQLIAPDGTAPAVRIVDYPEHGLRGTYEPDSIRMEWSNDRYHFTDANRAFIDWLASHKFNTVFAVENGAFFREEEAWLEAYTEMFAYARQRHIEPVPRICSISTVSPFEFEYYEGWYVQDEPFTFGEGAAVGDSSADASQSQDQDVAVAVHPFVDLVPNGSFELDTNGDGVPDGWSVTQQEGATWTLDSDVASGGERSMRLDIPEPAPDSNSATLRTTIDDIVPDSIYCLWSRAKATDIVDVRPQLTMYARNESGDVVVLQSDVTWSTRDWVNFGTCITTPSDAATMTLYSRIQSPGTGTFWLDDVHIFRVNGGLRNVIRANDTDIAVTDVTGARQYQLGVDYEIEDGATSIRFVPTLAPFVVRRLPGGAIPPGEEVRLSYDAYFFYKASQYWRSAPCVARDELYTEYYYPAIDKVVEHLEPEIINIDADEVRGFYRDSRMQRAFDSPGGAIAHWANRIEGYLGSRCPDCRLWIWDDMVSPYHNGGVENYQVNYGGLPGRMAEATELDWFPTSIIQDIWWYGDSRISQMWHSIEYFTGKGYDVLGSPWQEEENIVSWSEMLVDRPGSLGGVETNWGTPFEESHKQFADHFWNTRDKLLLFDSFEDDTDGDGIPDGWHAAGRVEYSTDGSQSHGARYAGFPNAAVQVTNETDSFESDRFEVRPNTDYTLSAYLRCDGACSTLPRLLAFFFDTEGRLLQQSATPVAEISDEYAKHEAHLTSPPGAAAAAVLLDPVAPRVWYDVIRFKEATRFFGIIGPLELPVGTVGEPYAAQLVADGGVGPHVWSIEAGDLPLGLELGSDGTIHGTPVDGSRHELTVGVVDASRAADARSFTLLVQAATEPPEAYVPYAESAVR